MPILFLALAVCLTGLSLAAPDIAAAQEARQENVRRPWSLRDLFAPRKSSRVEPPALVNTPKTRQKPKTRVVRAPVEPAVPVVEKAADASVVLVIGDFLGAGLSEGLDTVFADNPRVRIVQRTSGSSGFVRDDYHDWPRKAVELIDAEKPAVVLVMLGANDRQQMKVGDTREPPRSDNWTKEYTARTQALASAIAEKKVPFLWVGLPAFKSPRMSTDMLAFNDIYRASAEGAGAEYVVIWDGFVDEAGAYVTTGPDINGQPVRLRAGDGINMTKAGKRKVAFYVEKPLNKLLGNAATPGLASFAPAGLPELTLPPVVTGPIIRTVPVSLKDPALDGGLELLGAASPARKEARSPSEKLAIEGIAPEPAPGRADDFSWPPSSALAATPPADETTTAIRR